MMEKYELKLVDRIRELRYESKNLLCENREELMEEIKAVSDELLDLYVTRKLNKQYDV